MKTFTPRSFRRPALDHDGRACRDSKIEMSKLTCAQFAAYDKDNMGTIMMWLEGYYTEEDDDAVIDFGKMAGT